MAIKAALIFAAFAVAFSFPTSAQMACGNRSEVVAKLGGKYGETRRGGGLSGPAAIFEIWASSETGTWTILKTSPGGISCIMAVGTGWQDDVGEAPKGDRT